MLHLAYQSTGTEADDIDMVRQKLTVGKKAVVRVVGFQEDVRREIEGLFGRQAIESLALHHEDPITHSQEWQCTLYAKNDEFRSSRREQARRIASATLEPQKPVQLTSVDLVEEISGLFRNFKLDQSAIDALPMQVLEDGAVFVRAMGLNSPLSRGFLGEVLFAHILRDQLGRKTALYQPVEAANISFQDDQLRAHAGTLPHQVVFSKRDAKSRSFKDLIEADLLYRTVPTLEYVAFDVTLGRSKVFGVQEKSARIAALCEGLKTRLLWLDVVVNGSQYRFAHCRGDVYRMHIPCSVDFSAIVTNLLALTRASLSKTSSARSASGQP